MKRCVIVGGAEILDYEHVRKYLKADDYVVFCDSGLSHKEKLGLEADLIVGDFDSYPKPDLPVEIITLPCEKDDTDTFFAVKEAVSRGFDDFLLLGLIGQRLDHTLGNISVLLMLDSLGKTAKMIDDYSQMRMVSGETVYVEDSCAFFSLMNVSGTARGITIKNAKYPLTNGEIRCEYQYGMSNEVLPGKTASVTVAEGALLLIEIVNRY